MLQESFVGLARLSVSGAESLTAWIRHRKLKGGKARKDRHGRGCFVSSEYENAGISPSSQQCLRRAEQTTFFISPRYACSRGIQASDKLNINRQVERNYPDILFCCERSSKAKECLRSQDYGARVSSTLMPRKHSPRIGKMGEQVVWIQFSLLF